MCGNRMRPRSSFLHMHRCPTYPSSTYGMLRLPPLSKLTLAGSSSSEVQAFPQAPIHRKGPTASAICCRATILFFGQCVGMSCYVLVMCQPLYAFPNNAMVDNYQAETFDELECRPLLPPKTPNIAFLRMS